MDGSTGQETAFGGQLAGMTAAASGLYPDGGGWKLYLDPDDPARPPRLLTWPPHPGYGGARSLGQFGSTQTLGSWSAIGHSPDYSSAHRAFAVSAVEGTTRVVITDRAGYQLELTHAATHPDGHTQLFVGGSTTLSEPRSTEAFSSNGQRLAHLEHNSSPSH